MKKPTIILASQSIRRKRLLKRICKRFRCIKPFEPIHHTNHSVAKETMRLAKAKAQSVLVRFPKAVVISADTLLTCSRQVLGKPGNRAAALKMLALISGRTVKAHTSICVYSPEKKRCWTEHASVDFKKIPESLLDHYLASGCWRGKAGGFNIEEKPVVEWITLIRGDPHIIIGLPLGDLQKHLDRN